MTTVTVGNTRQATAIARHWIDGDWRDSAEHKDSINPATGEVIGRYALAGEVLWKERGADGPKILRLVVGLAATSFEA